MSTGYSANQYESAFKSQKLQNWTIPKHFKERESAWPSFQGTWDLSHHFTVYINPTARSQEGLDRLSTWGKTKSATSQAPKASDGSRATSRASQEIENINVNQPAKESQMPESNPNQGEPEPHKEQPRPSSQQNPVQSRPTSQSGQQVQSEQVKLQENQTNSRLASQHHLTRSRLVTQQSQVKITNPVQETSIAADTTPE